MQNIYILHVYKLHPYTHVRMQLRIKVKFSHMKILNTHLLSIERCDWSKQEDMFFVPQLLVKLIRRYLSFMAMLLLVKKADA